MDTVLEIDLENAQFDPSLMIEEAKKMGLDFEELEDLGFNLKDI